jgi:hypothetical protein
MAMTMRKKISAMMVTAAALLAASLLTPNAFAHHGWGSYKEDIEITLTITELKLGNPHDRLIATDADGQEWNLLMAPPARNRRFGFDETTVSVGQEVGLIGQKHPSRHEIKVHCLFRDGDAVYTYRYNGGTSSLKRTGRDERC